MMYHQLAFYMLQFSVDYFIVIAFGSLSFQPLIGIVLAKEDPKSLQPKMDSSNGVNMT